nr:MULTISPECIES: alcohol dehydrogenase catalytic domain-containing protein [Streptomyces]
MVRNGEFKLLLKYKPPFALGHDVAGVVTRVGSAVRGLRVGDEVYARPRDLRIGGFAEFIFDRRRRRRTQARLFHASGGQPQCRWRSARSCVSLDIAIAPSIRSPTSGKAHTCPPAERAPSASRDLCRAVFPRSPAPPVRRREQDC